MDLLAYWRIDNYWRDLDEGAGFNFNSRQSRLHSALSAGESLWLFSRVVGEGALPRFPILARLVVNAKTINRPGYKYGAYRVWGDSNLSAYFRVTSNPEHDAFELLQRLPVDSGGLQGKDRITLVQACQTIRTLKPAANVLLETFCANLPVEDRATTIANELELEKALESDPRKLAQVLESAHIGVSSSHRQQIANSYSRNRTLAGELRTLYRGRCQLCAFDSLSVYAVDTAEAHHIVYRARGGDDDLQNLVLVCPNHHTIIHRSEAQFDYRTLQFVYPNGRVEPLSINQHVEKRAA